MHQDWTFHHISVVVPDMERAIQQFESIGAGPFLPFIGGPGMPFGDKTVRGLPCEYDMDLRNAEGGLGGVPLEVIEPLAGRSVLRQFVEDKGEGLHHIAFSVQDLDAEIADMQQRGFAVIQTGALGPVKWAYFDGAELGGVVIELIQLPAE